MSDTIMEALALVSATHIDLLTRFPRNSACSRFEILERTFSWRSCAVNRTPLRE
jgi:hypothetical protein